MAGVREGDVVQAIDRANRTIRELREAEKTLAIIRSKKADLTAQLKKWKIDPNKLDEAITRVQSEIEELNTQLNERLDRADKIINKIQTR
jgi:septal ring factor EnvC (AmiA/AmiB activator)